MNTGPSKVRPIFLKNQEESNMYQIVSKDLKEHVSKTI